MIKDNEYLKPEIALVSLENEGFICISGEVYVDEIVTEDETIIEM